MPRAPLLVESVQSLIGETVYDPYGRILGSLVSFESDVDGSVQTIVVENAYKDIVFIPSEAVEITDGRIIVWPEWRVIANRLIASYQRALKRLKGLEEMYSRGEVPGAVYHELRKRLSNSLDKLKEEAKKLRTLITERMHDIEDENLKLDRAIANLKVSYLAGEISEKAYKIAIERLRSAKDSNARETEDLKTIKARIEALETGTVAFTKTGQPSIEHRAKTHEKTSAKTSTTHVKEEETTEEAKAPSIEGIQPIPVKLIEG